jgi:hypothetical protein
MVNKHTYAPKSIAKRQSREPIQSQLSPLQIIWPTGTREQNLIDDGRYRAIFFTGMASHQKPCSSYENLRGACVVVEASPSIICPKDTKSNGKKVCVFFTLMDKLASLIYAARGSLISRDKIMMIGLIRSSKTPVS